MKLHRFIGSFDLRGSEVEIQNKDIVHQIGKVLRLTPGEELILGDGKGAEVRATISAITAGAVLCRVVERGLNSNEAALRLTVYLAVLKRENFELALQKLTELGVSRVVPIVTARTVKFGLKQDRLEKIAKEAVEQSGRGVVPKIAMPLKFSDAVREARGENILLHLRGESLRVSRIAAEVGLWIGPEGGWTDEEVQTAQQAGFRPTSLGPRTLRAETAAIAGVALLLLQ